MCRLADPAFYSYHVPVQTGPFDRGTINVVDAMENLQELKVSQLGNKIRFTL